ncbi:MAG: infB [Chthoniobacteraceae bacterium]|nr:infB [Chthoniobacteraceae bacterium]
MATKTNTVKTAFKKITATKPADKSDTKPPAKGKAGEAAETKPETKPEPPKEAISLIDDKPKRPRDRSKPPAPGTKPFVALPSISRILSPEPPRVVVEPEPEPVPVVEEEPVAVVPEPEPKSDDGKLIHIKPPIMVKELSNQLGLRPFVVIRDLMDMNIFASINQAIEPEMAARVCAKHGFTFEREKRKEGGGVHKPAEKTYAPPKEPAKPAKEELKFRAPIVTFMGHVDHGKTTLMDAIRKTRVAAGEAGGITQHIGAYSVTYNDQKITFLDTPGHAAFTAMRARGATVTDIVVLVIAADDGLMPQTIEALNHAKAAKVHIVVAITKIDVPGANIDKVKGQLQEKGLVPEDWGGETIVCPVSAVKKIGIEQLLESILLVAEVAELRASAQANARGTVIESQIEQGRGPTATLIVKMGTLKVGDAFICGTYSGKVKLLMDDLGKPIKSALPSTPCKVLGFSGLPNAGDELVVMESEKAATALSEERLASQRLKKLVTPHRASLENLFDSLAADKKPVLNLILKCDAQGSSEAVATSLRQIESRKISLNMLHLAVGPITESDVLLAAASNAVVIGFNVKTESSAANTARSEGVQLKLYSIIYELIDQVKEAMAGMLEPENRETVIGHAEVKKVFELSKGLVAGSLVTDGRIARVGRARVLRGRQPIYDGALATLRRFTEDVKEVRSGLECGIKLGDFTEYEPGDIIECYTLEKVAQKL